MTRPEATQERPEVEVLTDITSSVVEDFQRLLPQLTSSKLPEADVLEAQLRAAVDPQNPDSRVVVIRDAEGRIQASATGNICRIPTGVKAWIDDVVTDEAHRGCGYGGQLMEALHTWFEERAVPSVNLTSNPNRKTAGDLYERMGYQERKTRVYRRLGHAAVVAS